MSRHRWRLTAALGVLLSVCLLTPESQAEEIIGGATGSVQGSAGERKWFAFRDRMRAASNGEIELRPMIYGELGSEEILISSVRRGRIQVSNLSGLILSTLIPEFAFIYSPFLFDSHEEVDYVLDNHLLEPFAELLAGQGLIFLSWEEIGFHHVYGKQPILEPADAKGIRFRVSSSLSARYLAQALGADVIPLPFSENIMGLQTGLVVAGENAVVMYARTGIAAEAPHLTLTNHSFATNALVANKRWFDGLSAKHQQVLRNGWVDIAEARRLAREEWAQDPESASKYGFEVHHLEPAQRDQWRQATAGVADQLMETLGGEWQRIWDLIQAGKLAFAQQSDATRE